MPEARISDLGWRPNGSYDSAAFKAQIEETARRPGKVVRNDGDAEKALASAAKVVSAEYYIPHFRCRTIARARGREARAACPRLPGRWPRHQREGPPLRPRRRRSDRGPRQQAGRL